jgi:hypothetical protein
VPRVDKSSLRTAIYVGLYATRRWRLSLDKCLVQAENPRQPVEMKSERTTTAQFPYVRCLHERHRGEIYLLINWGLIRVRRSCSLQPQLLPHELAETVFHFCVTRDWCFSTVLRVDIDVVPMSGPMELTTRPDEFPDELVPFQTPKPGFPRFGLAYRWESLGLQS